MKGWQHAPQRLRAFSSVSLLKEVQQANDNRTGMSICTPVPPSALAAICNTTHHSTDQVSSSDTGWMLRYANLTGCEVQQVVQSRSFLWHFDEMLQALLPVTSSLRLGCFTSAILHDDPTSLPCILTLMHDGKAISAQSMAASTSSVKD